MTISPKLNHGQKRDFLSFWAELHRKISDLQLSERILCVFAITAFVLLLVPLVWIAFYAVPCADDFYFAVNAHLAWQESGSLWEVLKAAVMNTIDTYYSWQGTFSHMFLSNFMPGTFNPHQYFLSPIFLISSFFLCGFFFCWTLFRRCFHASRAQYLMIAIVWLSISIQMLPSVVQGFYWNNGALLYTFFFSLSLLFFGLVILYIQENRTSVRVAKAVILCILAFVLGGGNYITSLQCVLFLAGALLLSFILKRPHSKWLVFPLLFLCVAFFLSITAPGNAIRQVYMNPTSVPWAVLLSFYHAAVNMNEWLNIPTVTLMAFLAPILWRAAKHTRFSFPFPILICLISFCVYASQFCPTIYAAGYPPHTRQLNIVFFSFILLLIFDLFYILGWASRHICFVKEVPGFRNGGYSFLGLSLAALVFAVGCFCTTTTPFTSLSAAKSLVTGEAKQFYQEYSERVELLTDETQANIHLNPYTVKPYVLYFDDATSDPVDWRNGAIQRFYGKESVIVE